MEIIFCVSVLPISPIQSVLFVGSNKMNVLKKKEIPKLRTFTPISFDMQCVYRHFYSFDFCLFNRILFSIFKDFMTMGWFQSGYECFFIHANKVAF